MTPQQYRTLRERLGLTQAGLAARLGITRKTINRREAGATPITPEAALAIRNLQK
jgi:DNA-binding XRE family transcriptional regulator